MAVKGRRLSGVQALSPQAPSALPAADLHKLQVSIEAVLAMRAKTKVGAEQYAGQLFRPYEPPKGVLPAGSTGNTIAMDAGFDFQDPNNAALINSIAGSTDVFSQGYAFPGFSVLSNWMQISEFRKPAEIYAREMTSKWIKFKAVGDEDKTEKISLIEKEFKRLNVQAIIRKAMQHDDAFGRAQIFFDLGNNQDKPEMATELFIDPKKIKKGSLKRLTLIEPIWSYPNRYNANDPLDENFYKPWSWYVMGREIHSTRMCTIVSREVPDILKPAYAFAGLSLSQMMKPYVDNWLRTRQSVSDLVHSFTVWVIKTDMSSILSNGGAEDFFRRLQVFNLARDNHGVNAINKDSEEFANVSAPIAGLHELQSQAQEQMSAPTSIPIVYLTGITPSGLNASNDSEIKIFKDGAASRQELYTPHLEKISRIVQLSIFGEVDEDITFVWEPLYTLSDSERAAMRKSNADERNIYYDMGAIDGEEVRKVLAEEEDSPFAGLDLTKEIEPPGQEAEADPEMSSMIGGPPAGENPLPTEKE